MSIPRLMLCREKVASRGGHLRDGGFIFSSSVIGAVPRITHRGSAVIHTPDRSGFPFVSRGAAAVRSTPPLAVRGARGLGYLNHCALSVPEVPAMTKDMKIVINTRLRICGRSSWTLFMRVTPSPNRNQRSARLAQERCASPDAIRAISQLDDLEFRRCR